MGVHLLSFTERPRRHPLTTTICTRTNRIAEKEMEERVKREVEEKMKKHEQELREQYERQIRQQGEVKERELPPLHPRPLVSS